MANLTETSRWEAGIYQWETSDPVQGGPNGIDNRPTRELANRTRWLYDNKLGKTGAQKIDGTLELKTNAWEKLRFTNGDGSYWRFETEPVSAGANGARFNYVLTSGSREIGRVQFGRVSGTENVAYQSWVNEKTNALSNGKMNVATTNYYADQSGGYTKSGFYRANGRQLDGNALPAMEIHIAHPEQTNGSHARGIGFSYGSSAAPYGLFTTAWDGKGNYLGMKTVLTELNGVMLTGKQTIAGEKIFSNTAIFAGGIKIGNAERKSAAVLAQGADDTYLHNPASNKYLQLKDDGTLSYSNDKILLYSDRSDAIDSDRTDKLATAKAVKKAYDGTVKKGGFTGAGNHEIAIGFGSAGIIAKVGETIMNVDTPVGTIAFFANGTPPLGWIKANGAEISRTVYSNLFAAIGTGYGAGDGKTTFKLPDLRGEFVRVWDDGRGIDANRALGLPQADAIQHWFAELTIQRAQVEGVERTNGAVEFLNGAEYGFNPTNQGGWAVSTARLGPAVKNSARTAAETRPRNIALMACIKI